MLRWLMRSGIVLVALALALGVAGSSLAASPDGSSPGTALPLTGLVSGSVVGNPGGAFLYYTFPYAGNGVVGTLTFTFSPSDPATANGVGLNVWQAGNELASGSGKGATPGTNAVSFSSTTAGPVLVQVYNYNAGENVSLQVKLSGVPGAAPLPPSPVVTALITALKPSGPPPAQPAAARPSGPPPTAPPSEYQPVGRIYGYAETLVAPEPGPGGVIGNPPCAISGVFERGQRIVWRYELVDLRTDKRITDKDGARVQVTLDNGVKLPGIWAERGAGMVSNAPWTWFSVYGIPTDAPLGSLGYSVTVTWKDGTTATWRPPALVSPFASTFPDIVK